MLTLVKTVRQVPAELRRRTLSLLALYIACGVDPEKCVLYFASLSVTARLNLRIIVSLSSSRKITPFLSDIEFTKFKTFDDVLNFRELRN